MKSLLAMVALLVFLGVLVVIPVKTDAIGALAVCAVLTVPVALLLLKTKTERDFLLQVFVAALLVRIAVGTVINVFQLQDFFGGDAITYDFYGFALTKAWGGDQYYLTKVNSFFGEYGQSAWGMVYMVGAVYEVIGRNSLAIQFTNAVFGAATAPAVFSIAHTLFQNKRVARVAALLVAFFPSLVLWSSQGLKDGPIVFLLVLAILLTLRLGEKFSLKNTAILCVVLATLISFRFYLFYMMTAAVLGAFIIGTREFTVASFVRQLLVVMAIGVGLTYMGVLRTAQRQAGYFGDLRVVERSRLDQSQAQSGFGQDVDVSTTEGALRAAPLGIIYLLFAPFPWEVRSLRQSITLPEMLIWWASFPLLILGLWFTIRHRLRRSFVILIFTTMLTLAYSIYQGNVGTAYRQRAQVLVFYFIFVAVGYVLLQEKREEKKQQSTHTRPTMEERPRTRQLPIGAGSPAKAS
jgi:4-amino-4-deoxy-L-arabinose transferase-like glycosyltransferase